jgi:large subunit ribosomal protein L21
LAVLVCGCPLNSAKIPREFEPSRKRWPVNLGLDGKSAFGYNSILAGRIFVASHPVEVVYVRSRIGMYAIVLDGSRQLKVEKGQRIDIDLRKNLNEGDSFEFSQVLAIGGDEGLRLGSPELKGAKVLAKVIGTEKGEKLFVQKFRRRKNFKRRTGHRQQYTRVEIAEIAG